MTTPFFPDDVIFLAECLDDHLDELQGTLKSIQDLCKKDERFAMNDFTMFAARSLISIQVLLYLFLVLVEIKHFM